MQGPLGAWRLALVRELQVKETSSRPGVGLTKEFQSRQGHPIEGRNGTVLGTIPETEGLKKAEIPNWLREAWPCLGTPSLTWGPGGTQQVLGHLVHKGSIAGF